MFSCFALEFGFGLFGFFLQGTGSTSEQCCYGKYASGDPLCTVRALVL